MSLVIELDANNDNDVANGRLLTMKVNAPPDVNRLLIFTGTAIVDLEGPDETAPHVINRDLSITLLNKFTGVLRNAATFVSLAAENNDPEVPTNLHVENVATVQGPGDSLRLTAIVEAGPDSNLLRKAYQANVLAHVTE